MKNFASKFMEQKHMKKVLLIAIWLVVSLILTFLIEIVTREDIESFKLFVEKRLSLFLLNYAIILIIMIPMILFNKVIAATMLPILLLACLTIAAKLLNDKRGVPFTGADIYSVKYGIDMIFKYFSKGFLIAIILGIVAFISGYIFLLIKEKSKRIFHWYPKLIISIIAIGGLFAVYNYNNKNNLINKQLWNLTYSYKENGFLFSFIDSFNSLKIDKPKNYSRVYIDDLDKGSTEVLASNKNKPQNIILIQLESFIDVNKLSNIDLIENPIPFISEMKKSNNGASLKVPTYGAGTVRTEFEVLTGYNMDFLGVGEVPNNSILKMKPVESLGHILRNEGYEASFIHNYVGNFYHRDIVYSNYGFDNFISKEYMTGLGYNGGYPKDINNLKVVSQLIEKEEPQFIFNVAVESHGPYAPKEGQKEYIRENNIMTKAQKDEFDYFLNRLNGVDNYVKELIKYLSSIEEETLVLFYSDHLPAIDVFSRNLLINEAEKYTTEYFVWSNYDIGKTEYMTLESYEISTKLLDLVSINSGIVPNFHRIYKDDKDYLEKFQNLQYDQLYGENYLKSNYKSTNLKLGINDINIKNIYSEGDKIIFEGDYFTESSKIYINGKEYETTVHNSNKLSTNAKMVSGEYSVIQKGMNNKILSESNKIKK